MEEMLEKAGVNDTDIEIKGPTQVCSQSWSKITLFPLVTMPFLEMEHFILATDQCFVVVVVFLSVVLITLTIRHHPTRNSKYYVSHCFVLS